jgi:hypothetical protein
VLRTLAARPELSTVGAIGYSEGALHAAWLRAHGGAAVVVMLAGPAQTGEEVYMRWAARLDNDEIPWPVRLVLRLVCVRSAFRSFSTVRIQTNVSSRKLWLRGSVIGGIRCMSSALFNDVWPALAVEPMASG